MPEPVVVKLKAIEMRGVAMPKEETEYEPPLILAAAAAEMGVEELRRRIAKGTKIVLLTDDAEIAGVLKPQIEYLGRVLESKLDLEGE